MVYEPEVGFDSSTHRAHAWFTHLRSHRLTFDMTFFIVSSAKERKTQTGARIVAVRIDSYAFFGEKIELFPDVMRKCHFP